VREFEGEGIGPQVDEAALRQGKLRRLAGHAVRVPIAAGGGVAVGRAIRRAGSDRLGPGRDFGLASRRATGFYERCSARRPARPAFRIAPRCARLGGGNLLVCRVAVGEPLAELRQRFDWSDLKVYDINVEGMKHGILLGTKRWA